MQLRTLPSEKRLEHSLKENIIFEVGEARLSALFVQSVRMYHLRAQDIALLKCYKNQYFFNDYWVLGVWCGSQHSSLIVHGYTPSRISPAQSSNHKKNNMLDLRCDSLGRLGGRVRSLWG